MNILIECLATIGGLIYGGFQFIKNFGDNAKNNQKEILRQQLVEEVSRIRRNEKSRGKDAEKKD